MHGAWEEMAAKNSGTIPAATEHGDWNGQREFNSGKVWENGMEGYMRGETE